MNDLTGPIEPTVTIPKGMVINAQHPDQWPIWMRLRWKTAEPVEFNTANNLYDDYTREDDE